MHGELPQELSVTVLETLGTGTGHAEGNNTPLIRFSSWMSTVSYLAWECDL